MRRMLFKVTTKMTKVLKARRDETKVIVELPTSSLMAILRLGSAKRMK